MERSNSLVNSGRASAGAPTQTGFSLARTGVTQVSWQRWAIHCFTLIPRTVHGEVRSCGQTLLAGPWPGGVPGGGCHGLLRLEVWQRRKPVRSGGSRWPVGDVPTKVQADACCSQLVSSCLSQQGENELPQQPKEHTLKREGRGTCGNSGGGSDLASTAAAGGGHVSPPTSSGGERTAWEAKPVSARTWGKRW